MDECSLGFKRWVHDSPSEDKEEEEHEAIENIRQDEERDQGQEVVRR